MGIVAGKEQRGIGDVLRHTHFRGVGQQGAGAFKAKFVCLRHDQRDVRQNTAGRDAIAADTLVNIHKRRILDGGDNRRLGSAIGDTRCGVACAYGSHIDNVACILALRQEYPDCLSHGIQGTIGVDTEQPFDHLIRYITDGGIVIHDAGIVHQHIQPAEFLDGRIDHAFAHGRIGYITGIGHHLTGGILQFFRQRIQALFSTGNRNDIGAFLGKQCHNRLSHTGRGAGDHDGFSFQFHR